MDSPSRSSNESDKEVQQQNKRKLVGRPKKRRNASKKPTVEKLPDIIQKARGRPKKNSDKDPSNTA